MSGKAETPFHEWPVDLHIEGVGYAWYRRDVGAFVTQSTLETATAGAADLVNDYLDHLILHEQQAFSRFGGVIVLYDWRSIQTVEPAACTRFMQRLSQREAGYLRRSYVVISPHASPLLEMALRAASAFAAMALGRRVEIGKDIAAAVQAAELFSSPRHTDLRSLRPVNAASASDVPRAS